jgi:hypothetical protein
LCFGSSKFRQAVFNDISTQDSLWNKIESNCSREILCLTERLKEFQLNWNFLNPKTSVKEELEKDVRNSSKSKKEHLKKVVDAKNSGIALSPNSGSIMARRRVGAFEEAATTAFSYLMEEDANIPDDIPVAAENSLKVPDVLLPREKVKSLELSFLGKEIKPTIPGSREFLDAFSKLIEKFPFGNIFLAETILVESEIIFKDEQVAIWAIESFYITNLVLTKMIVSCAKEDKYGQVHNSIPQVLEALTELHTQIELWIKLKQCSSQPVTVELFPRESLPPILKQFTKPFSNWKVLPIPLKTLEIIENSVYQIIGTFYTSLDRFVFDEKYSEKIQKFVDFAI